MNIKILKVLSEEMSLPLCMIFRKLLYKKNAKNLPNNYQPVSLTSVVYKILESIIKDAIAIRLETNTQIKYSQHGFCCCCLPTPMTLASGGGGWSPMFPLVVHQPASPSNWPAVQSLRWGVSTNPGVTMWCVCGCS